MEAVRNHWISTLRVVATISVIMLHVAAPTLYTFDGSANNLWWIGNIYDSLVRYCVPVFVMITGALLLPQKMDDSTQFVKKRFRRLLPPFIFWSIIFILIHFVLDFRAGKRYTFTDAFESSIDQFFHGSAYHLWYVYMLIGLYLFIPILSMWVRNVTEKELVYFLVIWIITLIISNIELFARLTPLYFTGYIGYLVLGYYLSTKTWSTSFINKQLPIWLFAIGFLVTAIGTYILSARTGKYENFFYSYLSINVLMTATGIFMFVKSAGQNSRERKSYVFNIIDKYSYGIYLVHVPILNFLKIPGLDANFINPIIGVPITAMVCLALSILVVISVNKLPFGKYISG